MPETVQKKKMLRTMLRREPAPHGKVMTKKEATTGSVSPRDFSLSTSLSALRPLAVLKGLLLPGLPLIFFMLLVLPLRAVAGPQVRVRCNGEAFEILEQGKWKPLFFKGVNLGAAPPGRFPGEFAVSGRQYAGWLDLVSELGANAIRVYTLHPPAFYEALLEHNGRSDSPKIWLFQGAWFELPEDLDLYNKSFSDEFKSEIRSVVDAVHGSASLPERPGHASGDYVADVSNWVAGYILGRECEPYAVLKTDELHADVAEFGGRFLGVKKGTPTECWFAGVCDFLAAYERDKFGWEHPISFTSWPTLDPMRHPTETERGGTKAYHDEDAASVDPSVIHASRDFEAGFFATFHAYPYYPDFMNLDPGYNAYVDEHGPCNYAGYLKDLKTHLHGMPLLIGETGIPTSRGIAHFQPQGLNHGGASEREQGLQDARLVEDCHREGTAGVLIFELFDEWFKDNWLVKDFEIPADRDVLWQNVQDPEEFFGLLAEEPPARSDSCFVDWSDVPIFYEDRENDLLARTGSHSDDCRDLRELRVTCDSRYVYLKVSLASLDCDHDGEADLDGLNLLVGFDTIDRDRGDSKLPLVQNVSTDAGMEFVLCLMGPDSAAVLVDSGYNFSRFSRVPSEDGFSIYSAPFRSRANADGRFERMIVETNRDRVDASGRVYPAVHLDVGRLVRAKQLGVVDVAAGDWRVCRDQNSVEFRVSWAILNVTDPSTRQVLDDVAGTRDIESSETDGLILSVLSFVQGKSKVVCDAMPDFVSGDTDRKDHRFSLANLRSFSWEKWDTAGYAERRKASFKILASTFSSLPDLPLPSVRARIATWPDDKDGAVSVSFDDGTVNQVEYALPILESLGIKATFALCADWTGKTRRKVELAQGCVREQLSVRDARRLIDLGHEIASHGFRHVFLDTLPESMLDEDLRASRSFFENELGESVLLLHYPFSRVNERVKEAARRAGFAAARGLGRINPATPDEFLLQSVPVVSDTLPSSRQFAELLSELKTKRGWLILTYHNVLPSASGEAMCYCELSPKEPYYVIPATFRKHMERLKKAGFYVAPERDVLEYVRARDNVRLQVKEERDGAVIKVQGLSADINHAKGLSLILELPWRKVRVEGSLGDSRFVVSNGRLVLKVAIGSEVIVHRED